MNAPRASVRGEALVRATLWLSVPFNMLAAYALALPASLPGRLMGLPSPVPPLYAALTGLLVALFGLAYAWMATQPRIERALLGFAVAGKGSVFVAVLTLWLFERSAGSTVAVAIGDLLLAALWLRWLLATRPAPT